MKRPCQDAEAYFGGELEGERLAHFESHLPSCDACKSLAQAGDHLVASVRAQAATAFKPPVAADSQRLLRKAAARGGERVSSPVLRWALAGAVAGLLAVAGGLWQQRAPELPIMVVATNGVETRLEGSALDAPEAQSVALRIAGDRLDLKPRTRVAFLKHDRQNTHFRLEKGSVAASVMHKQRGQSFTVEASSWTVSVVGTRFRVDRDGATVRVEVQEGHVRVTSESTDRRTYDVFAGQALQAEGADAELAPVAPTGELPKAPLPPPLAAQPDAGEPIEDGVSSASEDSASTSRAHRWTVSAEMLKQWRRAPAAGECETTVAQIRRELKRGHGPAEAWRALADCLRVLGKHREAAAAYRGAVSQSGPVQADQARLLLADLLLTSLKDPTGAAQTLRTYLQHPQPPLLESAARVKLARALLAQGRPGDARLELERVTRSFPASPPAIEALELLKGMGKAPSPQLAPP